MTTTDPDTLGGWRSRGYLPHFDSAEAVQHVTFHLADSLPHDALASIEAELESVPERLQDVERRTKVDAWLDPGHGSCPLAEPAMAAMVQDALLHFDGERYVLFAWVIVHNHVHVLFQPLTGWRPSKIVASWKRYTARQMDDHRRRTEVAIHASDPKGRWWHLEYWDRYIRHERQFESTVAYIHQNPVSAGLVSGATEWRWSSADLRSAGDVDG